jgi:rubrerythrin
MAKDKESRIEEKEHKKLHQVYKAGDKYHCGECGTEVDFGKNCPMCKKELNWAQIEGYMRR